MQYNTLISTDALAAKLGDPSLVIVDCRHNLSDVGAGEAAYQYGHVPGAFFLHLDRDLSGVKTGSNGRHPLPEVGALVEKLSNIGIGRDTQVVAYDQNTGMWASRLWWTLRWLGHDRVAVLDGGLDKWIAEGRPLSAELPSPRPARFERQTCRAAATADEILENLGDGTLTVLDARAPERFRGDMEPIDPVAGHIPGALNRPNMVNLTPQGTFKSPQTLRHEFEAQLGDRAPASVVHQCGSGVTACHNVLAMEVAGLSGSRLYPGSWSEWSSDPSRPIARGG
ncbi:MAG TPA: sulfurtransferase [Casimicrobiaceae bacterium]|jgi:thiosulfate/3-mercaptopyruvate sulfurtransferase